MANSLQAKKRIRQVVRRTEVNRTRRNTIRSQIRKVEDAIDRGSAEEAKTALASVEPKIMRGAQKGVFHKNTASRTVSRLAGRIKAINN